MKAAVVLGFHTEALERDEVWSRLEKLARSLQRREVVATFFVYPFPATVAGVDISDRVRALADAGHEIEQHTHFYAGDRLGKHEKRNDLSPENVRHCIERDLGSLEAMTGRPRGFVAGAWHVPGPVLDTLAELDFEYDSSARFPTRGTSEVGGDEEWLGSARVETRPSGSLFRFPTLCSLGDWFRWGRNESIATPGPVQNVYLHDYDLLRPRARLLLQTFVRWNGSRLVPGRSIVDAAVLRGDA